MSTNSVAKPIIIYSDVNLAVNDGSYSEKVLNEDSITQSIVSIISTRVGSRAFNRLFGSYIEDLLWAPMDDFTAAKISTALQDAIGKWEPRITIVSSTVIADIENQNYYAELVYVIPTLGNKSVSFAFNLVPRKA